MVIAVQSAIKQVILNLIFLYSPFLWRILIKLYSLFLGTLRAALNASTLLKINGYVHYLTVGVDAIAFTKEMKLSRIILANV